MDEKHKHVRFAATHRRGRRLFGTQKRRAS